MIFAGQNNQFRPILSRQDRSVIDYACNPCDQRFATVTPLLDNGSSSAVEQVTNDVCLTAFSELPKAFALPYATQRSVQFRDAMAVWPLRQSAEVFELLNADEPKAAIVLAYYCVLLIRVEDCWYLQGQGRRLLSDVSQRFGSRWKCRIEWPL